MTTKTTVNNCVCITTLVEIGDDPPPPSCQHSSTKSTKRGKKTLKVAAFWILKNRKNVDVITYIPKTTVTTLNQFC